MPYGAVSISKSIKKTKVQIENEIIRLSSGKSTGEQGEDNMKKCLLVVFIITITVFFATSFVYAEVNRPVTKPTRENILEDAVIDLLYPQMVQAAKKYYGADKGKEISFDCLRVLSIKKLDHPGSMMFEATIEGMSYSGPHNPPSHIFTVTIKKDYHTNGWEMKSFKVRKLKPNELFECRDPA